MDSQHQDPIQKTEIPDPDEVPSKYREDKVASNRGQRGNKRAQNDTRRQNIPRDQSTLPSRGQQGSKRGQNDSGYQNTPRNQSTLPPHGTTRRVVGHGAHHPAPANDSPGIMGRIANYIWHPNPKRYSVEDDWEPYEQSWRNRQINKEHSPEEVPVENTTSQRMLVPQNDITELKQKFQDIIDNKEREWQAREKDYELHINQLTQRLEENTNNISEGKERQWKVKERELQLHMNQIRHQLEENARIFQTKLRESETEKRLIQEQHNTFIRKQQEASFKQMESARWLPMDEGKVMGDLDRLKTDMRSWAKATSIKDISLLQSLTETESAAFMHDLVNVAVIENGQLPDGLSTAAKSPLLLLNALLAHSVYTSFFMSPFFFLDNNDTKVPFNVSPGDILEDVYERAQEANQQDAHIWRSQTLRLLMPPLRNNSSEAEEHLCRTTKASIAQVAERRTSNFLASPASYLIEDKANSALSKKLKRIYSDAATLSYMLWTRRTKMRCFTLRDIKTLAFDAESPCFDPDNLVRYDDHEDHLKGKMVTLIVHPLLEVYGSDEAEDYDQGRVWAKGVVWLESKNA